jgi:hypothetical protein
MVSRRQLADAAEDGPVGRRVQVGEVVVERSRIELPADLRIGEQALRFRPEVQPARCLAVVQRFDAGAVAGEQQGARPPIPDGDCEHPAKPLEDLFTPLLVTVHDRLGVARRGEPVTGGFERLPQRAMVVDFSVEDHRDGAVLVVDGLVPAGDVDDAQAPHADADARRHQHALVVGTTMAYDVAHRLQALPVRREGALARQDVGETRDSTHIFRPQPSLRMLVRRRGLPISFGRQPVRETQLERKS